MLKLLIYMLVLINPFSQLLYLSDLMQAMDWKKFIQAYWRASLMSLFVFLIFAFIGEFLFYQVFQVRLETARIFGGLITVIIGIRYFTQGPGSNLLIFEGDGDVAPRIALPFLVGPGTIWVAILIGGYDGPLYPLLGIPAVLAVNFLLVGALAWLMLSLQRGPNEIATKYIMLLMRTNALFIGAIGLEMIVGGIEQLFSPGSESPVGDAISGAVTTLRVAVD